MKDRQITKAQGRRFMLLKHGLLGPKKFEEAQGAYDFIRQVGSIQFDPIDVCGRNADLVLQSRVKGYSKQTLSGLLYQERRLVDYFDKELCIFPSQDWPYFEYMRKIRGTLGRSKDQILPAIPPMLDEIRQRGPLCSKDFDSKDKVHWFWGPSSLTRAVLEHLYYAGVLGIHHKRGTIKYYDLIERCLPDNLTQLTSPIQDEAQLYRFLLRRRIGAIGLMWNRPSAAWLGFPNFKAAQRNEAFDNLIQWGDIVPVRVAGLKVPLYMLTEDEGMLDAALREAEHEQRCELLAPLDNLLWDRSLIEAMFDFIYSWEIYVPQDKRKYGYYVLPLLMGEHLIARLEPTVDRKSGVLQVKGQWFEQGFDQRDPVIVGGVEECLARFEHFHQRSLV